MTFTSSLFSKSQIVQGFQTTNITTHYHDADITSSHPVRRVEGFGI